MKRRSHTALAIVLGMVGALLVSTGALAQDSPSPATTAEPVTLDIGVDSDVTSLNPFNICCGIDYEVMSLQYDLGFQYNNDTLEAAPGIVESWSHSEDYMDWTLNIREGATFSDGEVLDADDVAFSFGFIADNAMPFYKDYFPFEPTFEVVSPTQVIWHASQPTFAPEVPAYAPILPEHIWGQFTGEDARKDAKAFSNDNPVGSGPFKLVEHADGEFVRLESTGNWWGGQPASIQEIVFHIYDNPQTMVTGLKGGELDYVWGLNDTLFNSLEGEENIGTRVGDGGCWGNIAWNFGGQDEFEGGPKPGTPTADPVVHELAFRQAMAHSIDRQEIVDQVYGGTATIGHSILMPGTNGSWVTEIPEEIQFNYDPEQAKTMLEGAGITDTNGDGNREYQGQELNIEILSMTDVLGSVDTGKFLQGYMADVGVGSFITTVSTNKAYDLWYTGEWDVYVWDWCPDPDPDFMLSVFTSEQCLGWSDGCWSNPKFDELYDLQQTQLDRGERKATIDEMQTLVAEEVPTMVLNYWSDLSAYRTDTFDPSSWVRSPNNDTGLYLFGWTKDSYMNLKLAGAGTATASTTGLSAWVWVAVAVGVVLIVVAVVMSRRKSDAEEA